MRQQFQAFCATDDGATAIEYSFIASLVAIAGFATMVNLGDVLESMFGVVSNGVDNSVAAATGSG
jgi:Flp pilus assembly pilin Flp